MSATQFRQQQTWITTNSEREATRSAGWSRSPKKAKVSSGACPKQERRWAAAAPRRTFDLADDTVAVDRINAHIRQPQLCRWPWKKKLRFGRRARKPLCLLTLNLIYDMAGSTNPFSAFEFRTSRRFLKCAPLWLCGHVLVAFGTFDLIAHLNHVTRTKLSGFSDENGCLEGINSLWQQYLWTLSLWLCKG